jgi:uncharacterized membrane protein
MRQSTIWSNLAKSGKVESYTKLKTFESQISNGRKIFRLMLWLNELNEMHSIFSSEKLTFNLKILKTNSAICSFIYYFADNVVWFSKIGFLNKFIPFSEKIFGKQIKWRQVKDLFSLLKTVFELWIYIYTIYLKF